MRSVLRAALVASLASCVFACGDDTTYLFPDGGGAGGGASDTGGGTGGGGEADTNGGGGGSEADGGGGTGGGRADLAPGAACDCDDACADVDGYSGMCINGICMLEASADCSDAGSQAECPDGSRCWQVSDGALNLCWPDCDAFDCDGSCDDDGSCVFDEGSTCDNTCSDVCGPPYDGSEDTGGGEEPDCPPNSSPTPEGDGCYCDDGYTPNEALTACVPICESDADCPGDEICGDFGCEPPPCTPGSCAEGMFCNDEGDCQPDLGEVPGGTIPDCSDIPSWECTESCNSLTTFEPRQAHGYWDYPLNGETSDDQYRSYLRGDVVALVRFATAFTACRTADWDFGNGGDLGLGDMSEADGAIPGTSIGSPGHPDGTHTNGADIDIAYYQVGTGDNRLRAVCDHTANGADQYHCVSPPDRLDVWRTAMVLGAMHASPNVRVIGVDGQAGPLIVEARDALCDAGWLEPSMCGRMNITYETEDEGRGWYYFHHHHFHLSVSSSRKSAEPSNGCNHRRPHARLLRR